MSLNNDTIGSRHVFVLMWKIICNSTMSLTHCNCFDGKQKKRKGEGKREKGKGRGGGGGLKSYVIADILDT